MGYPPRIELPYGYYHVATRGNNRRHIYDDDRDRRYFLSLLRRIARRYGWSVYAYCLMGNHYHLVFQIEERGLSKGMCELNLGYALGYNIRHGRSNHLFGRRFWSEMITSNEYLLGACRYVVQNPIRAGLCETCEQWEWSSYRATVGLTTPEPFLAVKDVLSIATTPGPDPAATFREFCRTIVPKRRGSRGRWPVAATVTEV